MGNTITTELLEIIDNYLKGTLSEAEHLAFEKQIKKNKELQETVEIQRQLFAINGFETTKVNSEKDNQKDLLFYKEQLRSKENQNLSAKIKEIGQNHVKSKISTKKNYLKYYIAASIAIVFGTIFILNSNATLENYYNDNINWEELPSYIDKGPVESNFTKGEIAFKNKEYTLAISIFENISPENELYPYSLMYVGASYEQLNENDKALETFDQLAMRTDFEENSKAYWYKMLIYAKLNNKLKAKEMQNIIIKNKNNYKYIQALKLKI